MASHVDAHFKMINGDASLHRHFLWCAGHVYLLGGASPLFNLMEVKNE